MKKLTTVNDALLLKMQRESANEIYREDMPTVIDRFHALYPNHEKLNVLQMRAILAHDIEIVKNGSRKFFLILSTEIDVLNELNARTRTHNAHIRIENKRRAAEMDRMFREKNPDLAKTFDGLLDMMRDAARAVANSNE